MKKYFAIIASLALFVSVSIASAQITGGNVQCVRYNNDGSCAQWSVGITAGTGPTTPTGPTGGAGGGTLTCPAGYVLQNVGGQPRCVPTQQQQVPAGGYVQGQNPRQLGAQQADLSFINGLLGQTSSIVRMLPALLIGIAVVVFFVFLIKFVIGAKDDATKKKAAQTGMLYSLGAIFIMVALWGIIAFFGDIIGINPNVQVTAPTLPR